MTRLVVALGAIALLGGGCSTDPLGDPIIGVVRVVLTGAPEDGVLLVASTDTLVAEAIGPADTVLEDREIEWRSSDLDVATVDSQGRVIAAAEGSATISARSEGLSESVAISVREGTTVPNGGQPRAVTLLDGKLRLSVPVGVAPPRTVIHAREAITWPPNPRILQGSVVEIGPDGTELASNITVGITFTAADIPAIERPLLRLHVVNAAGQWVELASGTVDLVNSRVSGGMIRLAKVAIFRAAAP
jgi:hypothetical protein